jgi:hypothetical protein
MFCGGIAFQVPSIEDLVAAAHLAHETARLARRHCESALDATSLSYSACCQTPIRSESDAAGLLGRGEPLGTLGACLVGSKSTPMSVAGRFRDRRDLGDGS